MIQNTIPNARQPECSDRERRMDFVKPHEGIRAVAGRGNVISLKAGDVWKYGETTQGYGRYSQKELNTMVPGGVYMNPLFFGNQMEIKVQEKMMIYGYFFGNGSLPPGNNIFR